VKTTWWGATAATNSCDPAQTAQSGAQSLANARWRSWQRRPYRADSPMPLRCSIGMTVLPPHEFVNVGARRPVPQSYFAHMAQSLIQRADQALYLAKTGRRGRLMVSEPLVWTPLGDSQLAGAFPPSWTVLAKRRPLGAA